MAACRALLLVALLTALVDARSYAQAAASNSTGSNGTSNSTEEYPFPLNLLFPWNVSNSSNSSADAPAPVPEQVPEPEMVTPSAPNNTLLAKKVNAAQLKIKEQAKVACQNMSTMKAWAACMQTKVADMTVFAGKAHQGAKGQHLAVIRTNNADGVDDEGELGHSQAPASSKVRSKYARLVRQRGSLSLQANSYMMKQTGEAERAAMAKEIALLPADKQVHPKARIESAHIESTHPNSALVEHNREPNATQPVDTNPVEQPEPEPVAWFALPGTLEKKVQTPGQNATAPCDTKGRKQLAGDVLEKAAPGSDLTSSLSNLGLLVHSMEDKMKASMEEAPLMHTRVEHVLATEEEEAMSDTDRDRMQLSLNKHISEQREHIDSKRNDLSSSRDRKMFAAMASATQFETNANKTVARAAEAKKEVRENAAALFKAVDATVVESEAELAAAAKQMRADEDAVSASQRSTHAGIQSILRDVELARKAMNRSNTSTPVSSS